MIRVVVARDIRRARHFAEREGLHPRRTLVAVPTLPESIQRLRGHQFAPDEVHWTAGWAEGAHPQQIEDLVMNLKMCTILATRTEGDT